MKRALVSGITGQDGSYLAEILLEKGYEVHGIVRRTSSITRERIEGIYKNLDIKNKNIHLHYGDMTDSSSIQKVISEVRPDEIYNLAAMSQVGISFDIPEYTANCDGLGLLRILEAIRKLKLDNTKVYHASTSELYGKVSQSPQNEETPFHPRSPYGVAKLYSYWISKNYRDSYNMFICNGILFNHESPRRGENFVTRKISLGVAEIYNGNKESIKLGNLDAKRDWGYAPNYCEAMWLMLQQDNPDDYVISTGETHSIREFIEEAFKVIKIDIKWVGSGIEEKGIDKDGNILVEIDPRYFRPLEVDLLIGDSSKAKKILNWESKIKFNDLVKLMVESDIETWGKRP